MVLYVYVELFIYLPTSLVCRSWNRVTWTSQSLGSYSDPGSQPMQENKKEARLVRVMVWLTLMCHLAHVRPLTVICADGYAIVNLTPFPDLPDRRLPEKVREWQAGDRYIPSNSIKSRLNRRPSWFPCRPKRSRKSSGTCTYMDRYLGFCR